MARIQDYSPQVSAEGPLPGRSPERLYAEPQSFGDNPGLSVLSRGIEGAGDTLYNAAQRDETTAVAQNLAQLRQKWTAELQTRANTSAVDDPNFVQNFNTEVQNDLAGIGGNLNTVGGQTAFARGSAELTATMLGNANAVAVHAAGARAVNSTLAVMNANVATLNRDPTQLASILADTDAALNDPNSVYGQMPAERRDALALQAKEQYAIAAARATITQDPVNGAAMLKAGTLPGQQFIKGQSSLYLQSFAESAINGMRIKRIQQDADAERERRIQSENTGRTIFDSFLKNPGDTTLVDKVQNDPNMTWQDKASLLGAMGRSAKPLADHDINTYGAGFYDVYHALGNGQSYTQKQLFDMVGPRQDANGNWVDGPLTAAGVDKIIALQQSKRTPEGNAEAAMMTSALAAVKANLTYEIPGMPGKDPVGQKNFALFMQKFLPAFEAGKTANEKPADMLNFADPKSLISTTMAQFHRTPAQIMKDRTDELTMSVSAPKVGEVRDGYAYLGGDPGLPTSWKKQ